MTILLYIDTPQEVLLCALTALLRPEVAAIVGADERHKATLTLVDVDTAPLHAKHQQMLESPCIGFGIRTEPMFTARVILHGALGYVSLGAKAGQLVPTIVAAAKGNRVLSPEVLALVENTQSLNWTLTPRELEIMQGLAAGETCRQLGLRLGIETKTCDTHRGRVLKKLGLRNTAELARFAARYGYTTLV